ncbi:MAG: PrsW family glutamic-type intramembrane protease [Bacillota bacterium]
MTLLIAITVITLWLAGFSGRDVLWAVYWPGVFLLQFAVITFPWQAVPARLVMQMFVAGMSLVPVTIFLAQIVLYRLITVTPIKEWLISPAVLGYHDLMTSVVAPITEETLKVAPVIILLFWYRNIIWRHILGPIDVALLACASGTGFAFTENLLRITNNSVSSLGPDRIIPVASPHLGPFYPFPNMVASGHYDTPTVWFGHPEITAALGLALGISLFVRRKFRLWWLIPGVTLLWAIWDHFIFNYLGPTTTQAWTRILPPIDLWGRLLPYCFLAALLPALYITSRVQRWYAGWDDEARFPGALAVIGRLPSDFRLLLPRIAALLRFYRWRCAVAYGFYHTNLSAPEEAIRQVPWLWDMRGKMLVSKPKTLSRAS